MLSAKTSKIGCEPNRTSRTGYELNKISRTASEPSRRSPYTAAIGESASTRTACITETLEEPCTQKVRRYGKSEVRSGRAPASMCFSPGGKLSKTRCSYSCARAVASGEPAESRRAVPPVPGRYSEPRFSRSKTRRLCTINTRAHSTTLR